MAFRVSKEIRITIFAVMGACVLAVVITVLVMLPRHANTAPADSNGTNLAAGLSGLDLSDFQVPQSYTEAWKLQWVPSRKREAHWTWQEVQRYWHDPRKSALSSLTAENDKKVSELFKGVQ